MPRLFLIKHSMPEIDPELESTHWQLSPEGKRRCAWLASELTGQNIAILYSSIETRAFQTAERVARNLHIPVRTVPGLQENDRTDFPFIPDVAEWQHQFRNFFNQPTEQVIGRESANEAGQRFATAIQGLTASYPDRDIAVVCHGTVLTLFTAMYNKIDPFELWQSLVPLPAYLALDRLDYALAVPATCYSDHNERQS